MNRFLAVAAAALLAGCSTEPTILSVTMTADRSTVAAMDTVTLTFVVTNVSSRTISSPAPDSYGSCVRAFRVVDPNGAEIPLPTAFCLLILHLVELAPGEHLTIVDHWFPADRLLAGGGHALSGTYTIINQVAGQAKGVRSNRLRMTVTR